MKKVKIDDLIEYLNKNYGDGNVSVDDFEDGSGVYGILLGSRGYIDEIYKVENFKLRSKEELVNNMLGFCEGDEDERDYYEEFCDSYEIDWNDFGGYMEVLNEEECISYYNVEV